MLKYFKSYCKHPASWFLAIALIINCIVISGFNDFKIEMLLYAPIVYFGFFFVYVLEQKRNEKNAKESDDAGNGKSSEKPDDEKKD
ncbi:MAG: hypothetical protein MJ145_04280 [Clostridia bacterium]|nr:hypothetical protein [Clostridia bacterium]